MRVRVQSKKVKERTDSSNPLVSFLDEKAHESTEQE